MRIRKMNQLEADEIANNWNYDGVYAFYDMVADIEDYEEIMSESKRGDNYFSVIDGENLYGFFCVVQADDNIEIGLGMKPEHTGKGKGLEFINNILVYVKTHYVYDSILLHVASFNIRAIKVYEHAGFVKIGQNMVNTNGGVYEFTLMELKGSVK